MAPGASSLSALLFEDEASRVQQGAVQGTHNPFARRTVQAAARCSSSNWQITQRWLWRWTGYAGLQAAFTQMLLVQGHAMQTAAGGACQDCRCKGVLTTL